VFCASVVASGTRKLSTRQRIDRGDQPVRSSGSLPTPELSSLRRRATKPALVGTLRHASSRTVNPSGTKGFAAIPAVCLGSLVGKRVAVRPIPCRGEQPPGRATIMRH